MAGKSYASRCGSMCSKPSKKAKTQPLGDAKGNGAGWKKPGVSIPGLARRKRLMRGQSTK